MIVVSKVLTWHHITEKVIAQRLDPATTLVSSVMKTKQAVRLNDSAADAMSTMLHHKHRYLPVMNDGNDQLVGVLDIRYIEEICSSFSLL